MAELDLERLIDNEMVHLLEAGIYLVVADEVAAEYLHWSSIWSDLSPDRIHSITSILNGIEGEAIKCSLLVFDLSPANLHLISSFVTRQTEPIDLTVHPILSDQSHQALFSTEFASYQKELLSLKSTLTALIVTDLTPLPILFNRSTILFPGLGSQPSQSHRLADGIEWTMRAMGWTCGPISTVGSDQSLNSFALLLSNRLPQASSQSPSPCHVIIIDRRSDVLCCVGHSGTLLDRILHTLPRANHFSSDVVSRESRYLPMLSRTDVTHYSPWSGGVLCSGSIELREALILSTIRSSLKSIRHSLTRCSPSIPIKREDRMGHVKSQQLSNILDVMSSIPGAIECNFPLVLLTEIAMDALDEKHSPFAATLQSFEKLVLATCLDTCAMDLLCEFLARDRVPIDSFLLLSLFAFALNGDHKPTPTQIAQYHSLLGAALHAIPASSSSITSNYLDSRYDQWRREAIQLERGVQAISDHLMVISQTTPSFAVRDGLYHSTIGEIAQNHVNGGAPLPAVKLYSSETRTPRLHVQGYLSAKIDSLSGTSRPRKPTTPLLLVVIGGGITGTEMSDLNRVIASSPLPLQLLMIGTHLNNPFRLLHNVLQ